MRSTQAAVLCLVVLTTCLDLPLGSPHGKGQLAEATSRWRSNERRRLNTYATARVATGYEFIAALANPVVELILLLSPVVNVAPEAWNNSGVQLPITITRNISVNGDPSNWSLLRLHYARDMVRLMGKVTWSFRYVIVDGTFGDNVSRESGFQILAPTPPNQTSFVCIGPDAAFSAKFCIPKLNNVEDEYPINQRPASSPGVQQVLFNQSQAGCANRPEVPPLQRCWARKALIVDALGDGVRVDAADNAVRTNTVFWLRNVTGVCEHEIDPDCLQRNVAPLICYLGTMRKFANDTSSVLDNYMAELQLQQQQPQQQEQPRSPSSNASHEAGAAAAGAAVAVLLAVLAVAVWARRHRRAGPPNAGSGVEDAAAGKVAAGAAGVCSVGMPAMASPLAGSISSRCCSLELGTTEGTPVVRIGMARCWSGSQLPLSPAAASPPELLGSAAAFAHHQMQGLTMADDGRCHDGGADIMRMLGPVDVLAAAVSGGTAAAEDAEVVITPGTQPAPAMDLKVKLREAVQDWPIGSRHQRNHEQQHRCKAAIAVVAPAYSSTASGDAFGSSSCSNTGGGSRGDDSAGRGAGRSDGSDGSDGNGGGGDGTGGTGGSDHGCRVVELLPVTRGKGAFGRVVEGLYGGQRVAVKLLACEGPWGGPADRLAESFKQEVQVLSRCRHPNVVRLLAACVEAPRLCLVLELMETSLAHVIHKNNSATAAAAVGAGGVGGGEPGGRGGRAAAQASSHNLLPLPKVLHISASIANALAYLHPTVMHRDLKPANVLVNDPDNDRPLVKLTDFGLSRLRVTVMPTKHPEAGTPPYMAPECFDLTNSKISHKADIYSLGVLMWEMLTGERPWEGLNALAIALTVTYQRLRLPLSGLVDDARCPPKLTRLIMSCWEHDPDRRPAAAEVAKELALMMSQQQQQR